MLSQPSYTFDSPYHQKRRWTHPHTLRCFESALTLLGRPQSLLDVGCAEGVVVHRAKQHQITAVGLDLAVPPGDPALMYADLCEPIDLQLQFEWVLCWEVAEHLPETAAEMLCDTIARHLDPAGRVIFTAARPGQRGPGHLNLQPWAYWADKFLARGLTEAISLTNDLSRLWLKQAPQTPWYGRNVHVLWRVA